LSFSVLVVDDDPTFRALAVRLLVASGLTVIGEADSVASGLSAAMELKPAAVLVDVGLPDGDGFTLTRALTALPRGPRVVLTSVDADAGDHEAVRSSGALAFVPKAALPNASLPQVFGGD
jgi:DNA-binding NarL/FixJ family response regulator